jgi:hypothetical protein
VNGINLLKYPSLCLIGYLFSGCQNLSLASKISVYALPVIQCQYQKRGKQMSLSLAIQAFLAVWRTGRLPDDLMAQLRLRPLELTSAEKAAQTAAAAQAKAQAEQHAKELQAQAVQLLALLQRDARLVDFLREDIRPYPDAQVGAAVRTLHENCQKVLDRYLTLEPVMNATEGSTVTVPAGFSPHNIKLVGNVTGKPPLKGILQHRGWRITKLDLPAVSDTEDLIVAPAEVEIT